MSNVYKERPSVLLGITDVYTAYCLDEACCYITERIQNGEEPIIEIAQSAHYQRPSEIYAKYES